MALHLAALLSLSFGSTPRPSFSFIEELNRADAASPHGLGVDPLAGEPRRNFPRNLGEDVTDARVSLGPKLASEYVNYAPGYGEPDFYHGVASGSPTHDAVVVWTRYTPAGPTDVVPVTLLMAEAGVSELNDRAQIKYTTNAEAKNDWVIKIDVRGLKPGADYIYSFVANGKSSMVGMTKTAPVGHVEEMNYALFSCSHWGQGYFHPYDHASILEKLDWWIHVGDYIYEYGSDDPLKWGYSGSRFPTNEIVDPMWEIVELNDYRRRYALYHTDHGLQQLRARAPMIATWDDHEITNNWYMQGAQNHQSSCPADATPCSENEGAWVERVNAGAKAYLEWMPIRRGTDDQSGLMNTDIKQVIEWGDMATIVTVDTRGFARSADYTGPWYRPGAFPGSSHYPDGNPNSAVGAEFGEAQTGDAPTQFRNLVDSTGSYSIVDYETPGSEAYNKALAFKQRITEARWDPSRKKIGDYQLQWIFDKFSESKAKGQTWQIFGDATPHANFVRADMRKGAAAVPAKSQQYTELVDELLATNANWRSRAATAVHGIAYYNDDSNAVQYERALMMRGFKDVTNNPITLAGDVHDSRADTLFTDGNFTGEPEAVTFTQGGVTPVSQAPSIQQVLMPTFDVTEAMLFGEKAFEESNIGNKFYNLKDRGFWAFKVTHDEHIGEHINANYSPDYPIASTVRLHAAGDYVGNESVISQPFSYFHAQGLLTAPYYCKASLRTTAGQRGSLERYEGCVIKFLSARPAALSTRVVA